ncbi:MAG: ferredoxin--NADP(+) reductase [Bacteroidetes bacterium MED-G13]|nr:ferredoxin--NADP(+) reductase [Flavobacteriaceae bacterium]PDH47857.1 MAG: ferredoxin--NADP(+) reductase [Bacteroidetes bacterium MED-G13]|tara:strand:+ start:6726 stop:7778 length:1053 start_codon:yes stop_codon:yes gene_type:complete
MIKTDIIIIGAGPVGLFTVFEAGLLKMKCHLIDVLPKAGGQCIELYPKKPIYDIPAHPEILAGDLIEKLINQSSQFKPGFTLGEKAEKLTKNKDGTFTVTTDKGTEHNAPIVAIAGGLGGFQPRKPNFEGIEDFENKGIQYFIKDPKIFNNKNIVISGGGDSALDWVIELSKTAKNVTLVHRRNEFRGAKDSVDKVQRLKDLNKINILTPAEVFKVEGNDRLETIFVKKNDEEIKIEADYFIPLFGLTPRLGSINDWGLDIEKNSIKVNNALDYQTNINGIFAIGDINTYPGKLNLILCGFHEAALMCQAAFKIINPDKKFILKYTTVSGVEGFDGSLKKAEGSVVKSID